VIFKDRFQAAEQLVEELKQYAGTDAVVLAIPRGGLQPGWVIAKKLGLPLDIVLTKKIGAPGNPEYAVGAVSLEGRIVSDQEALPKGYIEEETKRIRALLKERYKKYLGDRKPLSIKNKIVILVDDGIATGRTMLATIDLIKHHAPKKIIVAIPVGSLDGVAMLKKAVDEVVCLSTPLEFFAIGQFYENFDQVSDEQAIKLLKNAGSKD